MCCALCMVLPLLFCCKISKLWHWHWNGICSTIDFHIIIVLCQADFYLYPCFVPFLMVFCAKHWTKHLLAQFPNQSIYCELCWTPYECNSQFNQVKTSMYSNIFNILQENIPYHCTPSIKKDIRKKVFRDWRNSWKSPPNEYSIRWYEGHSSKVKVINWTWKFYFDLQ